MARKADQQTLVMFVHPMCPCSKASAHELARVLAKCDGQLNVRVIAIHDENAQRSDYLKTIQRNGEHLLCVLNDILDISKIEAGWLTVDSSPCSPAEVVCEVVSLMRPRAADKGIDLRVHFDGHVPQTILSDATRLRQVLLNLLSNAIKFTDRGDVRVTVRLLAAEQKLSFIITDTGIGVGEEQLARLFRPFEQADSSLNRRYGGTGLGLAISKRLSERLGGDITVTSAPARGSTFTVTIATGPLEGLTMVKYASEAVVLRPNESLAQHTDKLADRILLADDSADARHMLKRILEKSGLTVETADNGSHAVDRALATHNGDAFDLILMDMQSRNSMATKRRADSVAADVQVESWR